MKRFERVGALGTLSLLAAVSAAAQAPSRTTVQMKTPLQLLAPDATFMVMANETRAAAASTTITVTFHDAGDRVLKTVSSVYRAGTPAVIALARDEAPGTGPLAVWADVSVSRTGDFSPSAGAVSFTLLDATGSVGCHGACHTCPTEGPDGDVSCAQPEGGRKPEFSCPDGSAYIERISVIP
jgi:hypothetical protein